MGVNSRANSSMKSINLTISLGTAVWILHAVLQYVVGIYCLNQLQDMHYTHICSVTVQRPSSIVFTGTTSRGVTLKLILV